MSHTNEVSIELAIATPAKQELLTLGVPAGTTVAHAIELSGIAARFADENIAELQAGIWGKPVDRLYRVQNGDRVELYRPLTVDPKEARRSRAKAGKS